jgi:hypothetical protein
MPSETEYRYCARLGMSQVECAAHLGKAKQRLDLIFGDGMGLSQGRQWDMEFFRYPWGKMEIGDWVDVPSHPAVVAYRANQRNPQRRFVSITADHRCIVKRAA